MTSERFVASSELRAATSPVSAVYPFFVNMESVALLGNRGHKHKPAACLVADLPRDLRRVSGIRWKFQRGNRTPYSTKIENMIKGRLPEIEKETEVNCTIKHQVLCMVFYRQNNRIAV
jgi:hypothetical protein